MTAVQNLVYLLIVGGSLAVSTACGAAKVDDPAYKTAVALAASLTCTLPANVAEQQALVNLAPTDFANEKLAREHIELFRRARKGMGDDWNMSAALYYFEQARLLGAKNLMQDDRKKAQTLLKWFTEGHYPLGVPIDAAIKGIAEVHNDSCTSYIQDNAKVGKRSLGLAELRREKKQPWLDPRKRLPCAIQEKPGCMP